MGSRTRDVSPAKLHNRYENASNFEAFVLFSNLALCNSLTQNNDHAETRIIFHARSHKRSTFSAREGNWPIGCVLELDGKIIARSHNTVYSQKNRFGHAEMQGLQAANDILNKHPNEITLYTTYEPCPMCFGACILGKMKKVVCGIDLDQSGAMYFREHLPLLFKQDKFHIEFERGLLADKCAEVFLQGEPTKKLIDAGIVRISKSSGETVSRMEQEL